jgi:hypothetical protein
VPPPRSAPATGRGRGGAPAARAARPDPDPPRASAAPAAAPAPEPAEPGAPLEVVYDRLAAFAQQENRGLFAALAGGRLVERAPGRLRIRLASGIAARRLAARDRDLEAVCGRFFGEPMRVELETDSGGAPARSGATPADDDAAARRRKQRALDDPGVNAALEVLGGEIVEIRPLGEDG